MYVCMYLYIYVYIHAYDVCMYVHIHVYVCMLYFCIHTIYIYLVCMYACYYECVVISGIFVICDGTPSKSSTNGTWYRLSGPYQESPLYGI